MKRQIDILHIYAGTGGSAGTYIDGIYSSLNEHFSQECIVNHYFPFKYGRKIFYKITEMTGPNFLKPFPKIRLVIRMLELICALVYSLFFIFITKPKVVNYSMTSNLYVEYIFLKLLKIFTSSMILITCHDVLPFESSFTNVEKDRLKREHFFILADYLLVHNLNSKDDLMKYYNILDSKIIHHRFPIMNLEKMNIRGSTVLSENKGKERKLLFIGHMRKEKGIDVLIKSWELHCCDNLSLTVAGNVPTGFDFNFNSIKNKKFTLINKFLNDSDFINLIKNSDFVILPYTGGTNSGIPSSIISLGSIPITSDIAMFKNNALVSDDLMFDSGDCVSLVRMLDKISNIDDIELEKVKSISKYTFDRYTSEFNLEIKDMYEKLL